MSHLNADARGLIVTCPACGQANRLLYERLDARTRCGRCRTEMGAPGSVVEIGAPESFNALIGRSPLPVFVDFWAPWCGPCRSVAPEIEKLAGLVAGEAIVAKVNTEELPSIASRLGIQSIPTFVVFRKGREAARTSGAMPAARLQAFVRQSGL